MAYINDIPRLKLEIAQPRVEHSTRIDDESFRFIERSANHQDAPLIGAFGKAPTICDCAEQGRVRQKSDGPRTDHLTEDVNVHAGCRSKINVIIRFDQGVLRQIAFEKKLFE